MKDDFAIEISNVSKTFKLPHERHNSVKSALINRFRGGDHAYSIFNALDGVSINIKRGEFFGIVGRNGSGKSTLLKLLAGIYMPSKGTVKVNGKLTPFIELGVGFNHELTGRENVFLNGALLGFSRKDMDAMYQDIVDFAEIEEFMDQKLKNYSSGMQVRLAFSIAIRAKSDILLIDEVLAVGDANFQKKCMDVFEDLKRAHRTIVFITHSMDYVRQFCDRVAVLDNGKLLFNGNTEKGIDVYNKLNFEIEQDRMTKDAEKSEAAAEHLGNGKAEVEKYKIYDTKNNPTTTLVSGEKYSVQLVIHYKEVVNNPAIGIMFRKNPQENLYGINSFYEKKNLGKQFPGSKSTIEFQDILPLNAGEYYFTISVSDAISAVNYEDLDLLNNVTKIMVTEKKRGWGVINNHAKIEEVKIEQAS